MTGSAKSGAANDTVVEFGSVNCGCVPCARNGAAAPQVPCRCPSSRLRSLRWCLLWQGDRCGPSGMVAPWCIVLRLIIAAMTGRWRRTGDGRCHHGPFGSKIFGPNRSSAPAVSQAAAAEINNSQPLACMAPVAPGPEHRPVGSAAVHDVCRHRAVGFLPQPEPKGAEVAVVTEVIGAAQPNKVQGPAGTTADSKYGAATGRPPRRGSAWILPLIPPRASKARRMVCAWLTRGALAAAVTVLAAAIAGCGQESPAVAAGPDQGGAGSPGGQGATARVGSFVEVIGARIPAPPARSAQAQVEMTLANTNPAAAAVLLQASSPAARRAEFTSRGHVIARITIPTSAGSALPIGPPNPDRLVLTGLRRQLRPGQLVTLDLTFARAGHATLRIPVIP
jgi:copper(I)-binding protein